MSRFVCDTGKVKEPKEVVGNDKDAGREERDRGEGDEGPGAREVLEVHNVADEREDGLKQRKRVRKVEYDVEHHDHIDTPLPNNFC